MKMEIWNSIFLYNPIVFRFHVHLPGRQPELPKSPEMLQNEPVHGVIKRQNPFQGVMTSS